MPRSAEKFAPGDVDFKKKQNLTRRSLSCYNAHKTFEKMQRAPGGCTRDGRFFVRKKKA